MRGKQVLCEEMGNENIQTIADHTITVCGQDQVLQNGRTDIETEYTHNYTITHIDIAKDKPTRIKTPAVS